MWCGYCRGDDDEKEYLVKWKELSYDDCYWEFESDISAFQPEIDRFNRIQSRSRKLHSSKQKTSIKDAAESKNKQKEFQQYERSPQFLSGGTLVICFSFWYACLIKKVLVSVRMPKSFWCNWRYTPSLSARGVELLAFLLVQTNSCDTCWWNGTW